MKQVAIALFVLVFVAGGCAGQGEEDTTTAVAGQPYSCSIPTIDCLEKR
jgi:hypothetical protein